MREGYKRAPEFDFSYDGPEHHIKCPVCPDGGMMLQSGESREMVCEECRLIWDSATEQVWLLTPAGRLIQDLIDATVTYKEAPIYSTRIQEAQKRFDENRAAVIALLTDLYEACARVDREFCDGEDVSIGAIEDCCAAIGKVKAQ